MQLTEEKHLFGKKWAAYRNEDYQESYREVTEETELKGELFTARTVTGRSGSIWADMLDILERFYVGTYFLLSSYDI